MVIPRKGEYILYKTFTHFVYVVYVCLPCILYVNFSGKVYCVLTYNPIRLKLTRFRLCTGLILYAQLVGRTVILERCSYTVGGVHKCIPRTPYNYYGKVYILHVLK